MMLINVRCFFLCRLFKYCLLDVFGARNSIFLQDITHFFKHSPMDHIIANCSCVWINLIRKLATFFRKQIWSTFYTLLHRFVFSSSEWIYCLWCDYMIYANVRINHSIRGNTFTCHEHQFHRQKTKWFEFFHWRSIYNLIQSFDVMNIYEEIIWFFFLMNEREIVQSTLTATIYRTVNWFENMDKIHRIELCWKTNFQTKKKSTTNVCN